MTTEDLMKPRYKVIALWPGCGKIEVGKIIDWIRNLHTEDVEWCKIYDAYPHLFRKLEWWEDRDEKDMPEYVKTERRVYKLSAVSERHEDCFMIDHPITEEWVMLKDCKPATEIEYTQYTNKQKQSHHE